MEKKNEPVGLGWTIAVLVIVFGGALLLLGIVGGGIYFGWDALCVSLDPNNTTAACRFIN